MNANTSGRDTAEYHVGWGSTGGLAAVNEGSGVGGRNTRGSEVERSQKVIISTASWPLQNQGLGTEG